MRVVLRHHEQSLEQLLERASGETPTWHGDPDAAGHPGFHSMEVRRRVGSGEPAFAAASDAVAGWGAQRGAGLVVRARHDRVQVGGDVVVGMPAGPLLVPAPCRVSDVFDEPGRRGFRYVTLPGHPEQGFEEFSVERASDGGAWFTVRAVSRPGSALVAMALPVYRVMQRRITGRYVEAVARAAAGA